MVLTRTAGVRTRRMLAQRIGEGNRSGLFGPGSKGQVIAFLHGEPVYSIGMSRSLYDYSMLTDGKAQWRGFVP